MKKSNTKGSAILEALIAAVIFVIALFSLVAFQTNLLRNRGLLSQESSAMELAENKMDQFRSYTSTGSTASPIGYADITSGSTTTSDVSGNYTITWTVTTNSPATDFPTRKNVRVLVSWTDANGVFHNSTNTNATNGAVYIDSVISYLDPAAPGKISQRLP
jgi:Tfp pilus assembly protein PilV